MIPEDDQPMGGSDAFDVEVDGPPKTEPGTSLDGQQSYCHAPVSPFSNNRAPVSPQHTGSVTSQAPPCLPQHDVSSGGMTREGRGEGVGGVGKGVKGGKPESGEAMSAEPAAEPAIGEEEGSASVGLEWGEGVWKERRGKGGRNRGEGAAPIRHSSVE